MKKILLILTALTVSAAAFAEKITTVAGITSGYKYYIGATTGDRDFYFYVDGSAKTESMKGVAKEDVADAVALTFTAETGGWTIKFDNGLYLGIKNAKDNGAVQVMEDPVVWTIEEDADKGLLKLHPNDYYLQKNNSGTQFGSYKANQTNVWLESAGSTPVLATLDSLVIKGMAEKMEYELDEAFDPAGLEVWGIYTKYVKNDSTSQIKSGITWTLDPETFEEASDNASVTLVASYKDLTTADTTITGIKVNAVVPKATENPTITPSTVANVYWEPITVTLACATEGASIYYTLDGSEPTASATKYTAPFSVTATTTVKAIAIKSGLDNSEVVSKTFTFGTFFTSLEELVANQPAKEDVAYVQVTITNAVIDSLYVSGKGYTNGIFVTAANTAVELYTNDVPETWEAGGKVSGTIKAEWRLYKGVPELQKWEGGWDAFTYTAPASGPTVDETGITVNGRKYGFPVRLVKEVPGESGSGTLGNMDRTNGDWEK